MPNPSLLVVPARFKTGRLYSQIPSNTDNRGDFNVTRATAATRVNASGFIESVASGIPRLDYFASGGTVGCPALLVEPIGSNVLSYSEEFTNAAWTKNAMTVSTGTTAAFTAPDGTTNADKIIATTASGVAHSLQRTGFASAAYTFSVFAKAGEESVISLWLRSNSVGAVFNLVSGTVSNITVTSARIENYGNGWYRCSVYDSTAGTTASVYGRTGGGYTGNGVDGFYLWGAQLETGSVATSYIPTTTAAVTRNADVVTLSGAVSGCIGQTEGTLYAEFEIRSDTTTRRLFALSDGTQTNRVFLYYASNALRAQIQSTSVSLGNPTDGYHKVAFAYQQSGVSGTLFASLDGGAVVSGTTAGTFPASLTTINIGKIEDTNATSLWNSRIRAVALYTTRLTNDQLQALTT